MVGPDTFSLSIFQEVVLPFPVHHLIRNIRDTFPLFQRINSTGGHQDMQVGVIMAGPSGGLQDGNVSMSSLTPLQVLIISLRHLFPALMKGLSNAGSR